jgi:hypothetical protein
MAARSLKEQRYTEANTSEHEPAAESFGMGHKGFLYDGPTATDGPYWSSQNSLGVNPYYRRRTVVPPALESSQTGCNVKATSHIPFFKHFLV